MKHGFSVGNFGLTAASTIGNSTTPIIHLHFERLITWKEVLDGKSNGIQIWRKSSTLRNLYNIFYNRRKSLESCLQDLLIGLHEEVFGDRVQLYHLLSIYYRICAIHICQDSTFHIAYICFLQQSHHIQYSNEPLW